MDPYEWINLAQRSGEGAAVKKDLGKYLPSENKPPAKGGGPSEGGEGGGRKNRKINRNQGTRTLKSEVGNPIETRNPTSETLVTPAARFRRGQARVAFVFGFWVSRGRWHGVLHWLVWLR